MKTLLIIKPDAYRKGLEQPILERISAAGLAVVRSLHRRLARAEVEELYEEHRGKPFFDSNRDFILSGEVGLFVIEGGPRVVAQVRELVGDKDPRLAAPGTIRGDFGIDGAHVERNLVHASSSPAAAAREITLLMGERG